MKSYSIYGPEKWERYFTDQIHKYMSSEGYGVSMQDKMKFCLDITDECDNWYGVVRKNIVFQNNHTDQFFIINHADQHDDLPEELVSHPLCIGILKCQYRQGSYGEWEDKVSAFTYGVKEWDKYFVLRENMKGVRSKYKRMYFKGNENGRKIILLRMLDMGLINSSYGLRKNGRRDQQISQDNYLQGMAESVIALSLPGAGNFCHRELEAFGIGVPVLMPTLVNQYYKDLIPDIHYIAVDASSIGEHNIKDYSAKDTESFCILVEKRFNEAVDDTDFLNRIIRNASQWFDDNVVFPFSMRLMEKILLERYDYHL